MRVIITRHAESENNIRKAEDEKSYDSVKVSEPSISEKGEIQAENLGAFLKENGVVINKSKSSLTI
jgi:broad specificity phosphatase PhoE